MTTFGQLYLATSARLAARVRLLSDDDLARPVPACPSWDVHDVVAHVVGAGADRLAGRLDGFPGDAWSSRHVAERRGWTATRLAEALHEQSAAVAAVCDAMSDGPNNAWDALVHEQDVAEALDPTSRWLAPDWELVLDSGSRVLAAGRGVRIAPTARPSRGGWPVELTVGDVHARAVGVDPYELMRAMFSRRTVARMAGWRWDTDVREVVHRIAFFGPARPPGSGVE